MGKRSNKIQQEKPKLDPIEELTPQELLMITDNWDITNERRATLIKHKVYGTLSEKQSNELEYLQELTGARRDMLAPMNLAELEAGIRKMFREIEARDGSIMICPKCDVLKTIGRWKYRFPYIGYHKEPRVVILDSGLEYLWCKSCDWETGEIAKNAATKFNEVRKHVIERYFEIQTNQLLENIFSYYENHVLGDV